MGHGGDQADDTILSSLLSDFLALGCSTSGGSTDHGDVDAASAAGASGEGVKPADGIAMALKARKVAERITSLLDEGVAGDVFQVQLARDVYKAMAEVSSSSSSLRIQGSRPAYRRAVASWLKEISYDAAVCQARWRATRDVCAGSYEYIDVVTAVTAGKASPNGERYIVDIGFAAEFVVARPTGAYAQVLEVLPRVLVARPMVVRQVVKLASKAARRSLKSQGLTVPPWRKKRFMAAKWLGPYRRAPSTAAATGAPIVATGDVMCRTVGFLLGPQVQPWLST